MGNINEKTLWIALDKIRVDGGTQMRAVIDSDTVEDYAEHLADLPPCITFFDGCVDWLADGFHRYAAHHLKKSKQIEVERRVGTHRDAILFSLGANAQHGLRRTNADKRKAVETMLADEEWGKASNVFVSEKCGVGEAMVRRIRAESELVVVTTNSHKTNSSLQRQSPAPAEADPADDMDFTKKDDAPAEPQAKPEPPKDKLGNIIGEKRVVAEFADVADILELLGHLKSAKAIGKRRVELNRAWHLSEQNFIAAIANAYSFAKELLPYAVCSFCGGRNSRCKACKGSGFLTKHLYENTVPREMKDDVEV